MRGRPRKDEDEHARQREPPDTLEDDEEIGARLVVSEEELKVRYRLVLAPALDLKFLHILFTHNRETGRGRVAIRRRVSGRGRAGGNIGVDDGVAGGDVGVDGLAMAPELGKIK